MRNDVHEFCRSCLVCSTRKGTCGTCKPPLQPIPVGGPFHQVGVDILQLPLTTKGNRYVVVFMDYLTKWPEAFAIPDQTAETIAKVLVEEVICVDMVYQRSYSLTGELTFFPLSYRKFVSYWV